MDRNKALISLILAFVFSSLIFQNCSGMESNITDDVSAPLGDSSGTNPDDQPNTPIVPAYFVNKSLNLDNVGFIDSNASGTFSLDYSTGSTSPDIFYYETEYLATYESTLVTIKGENGSYLFKVKSDACTASKEFTAQDQPDFQVFFQLVFNNATTYVPQAGDTPKVGCSFPRLALSVGDASKTDLDIYFTSKECTPANSVHVTDVGGEDPAQVISDVDTFFKDHINSICPQAQ